jgi:hypothetical protein
MVRFFRVQLHGTGILVDGEADQPPIVGFYTTRSVKARSPEDAVRVASQLVTAQWNEPGAYAEGNRASLPHLSVEWVRPDSFLSSVFFRGTGHCFYWDEAGE